MSAAPISLPSMSAMSLAVSMSTSMSILRRGARRPIGELLAVTDERDFVDLCKADKGLPQVNCDPWGGWVCVDHLQPPSQASQGVRGQGRSRDGAIPA